MEDFNNQNNSNDNCDVLLNFLKMTKEGSYAQISPSNLNFARLKETTEHYESYEDDFYFSVR